jgi:hypothetical protein
MTHFMDILQHMHDQRHNDRKLFLQNDMTSVSA